MGLFDALIKSAKRFQAELLPIGYEQRHIEWVFDIDIATGNVQRNPAAYKRSDMTRPAPKAPGDRTSGKASPTLFVDDASYVLGTPNPEKKDPNASQKEHDAFLRLHRIASRYTRRPDLRKALDILENLPSEQRDGIEPKDATVLRLDANTWLFDLPDFQHFWSRYLEKRLSGGKSVCALCGELKPALRILPFRVRLFGQNVPIVSINTKEQPAFGSQGKDQLANATACYSCLGNANQVLQYLLLLEKDDGTDKSKSSGRHAVVLAREDSKGKGKGKQPLRNQIAVFWTKEQMELQEKEGEKRQFEDLAKVPIEELDEAPEDAPPAKAGQCRALLEAPFIGGKDTARLPANRFYLAVLSPNKSRLVVREWLETDIEPVHENIKCYMEALQIVHPDGRGVWWPPLPAMLEALRSYTSRKQKGKEGPRVSALGPDVMCKVIRCIYTGTPPPESLLTRAVRCFRIPDAPTDDTPQGREQRERQMFRLMAMAAAMKLVLTYNKNGKEQKAMEKLKTEYDAASDYKQQSPYNCGVLLAILEAIQRRASSSGRGVNTTVVDRFYGAASTAPATVFANLINMATKAHLPKLRREGKEFFKVRYQEEAVNINDLMTEACDAINAAGGFPPPLTPQKQAEFALGFYHQRAELNLPKRQSKRGSMHKTNTTGGQL
jgi:CRISPR-associated protein Csd1